MSTTSETDTKSDLGASVLSKATIISRLKQRDVVEGLKAEAGLVEGFALRKKRASVLVPLIVRKTGDVDILLTVRAQHLRNHGGEVAFPGGKQDEEDADETATALREAWEEIGLYQTDVEVVSQLPPIATSTGFFTRAITAIIPEDFKPNINPNEVDNVFQVPLIDFLKRDHHEARRLSNTGRFALIHFFTHTKDDQTYVTYGLTAYFCILAACCVFDRVPDFEMEPDFDPTDPVHALIDFIKRENGNPFSSSATSSKI